MFFFLAKILEIFIYPLTWIAALAIAAVAVRKPLYRRRLSIITAVAILLFSNPFLLGRIARWWDIRKMPAFKPADHYSCAIVLGGFASENPHGGGYFNGASDRFIEAVKLFKTGRVSHILVSSGNASLHPDGFREADWVKTQLQIFGVPDSCILIEDQSRNTRENASLSKAVLQKAGLHGPYLLVTSAFHMRRALGIFKDNGFDVIPYPCHFVAGNGPGSLADFIPDGGVIGNWNTYTKEIAGTIVNQLHRP